MLGLLVLASDLETIWLQFLPLEWAVWVQSEPDSGSAMKIALQVS